MCSSRKIIFLKYIIEQLFVHTMPTNMKGGKIMTPVKKSYKKPVVKSVEIDKTVMVAASRSGMGNCKITYIS